MDPEETLQVLRDLSGEVLDDSDRTPAAYGGAWRYVALDLAAKFEALDEWLSKGGFPPAEWKKREGVA